MDCNRFDRLARTLAMGETRRWLLRSLAGLSLAGALGLLADVEEEAASDGRRKRRKKRHKHGQEPPKNRKGKRKGRGKGRRRKNREDQGDGGQPPCQADPLSVTCADACGSAVNNCGEQADCGPCCGEGQPPCGEQCIDVGAVCQLCPPGGGGVCGTGVQACIDNSPQCVEDLPPDQERCDGVDNDGDGVVDEGANCPDAQNATGACVAGACELTCNEGFGDCDGILENGCETNTLTDPDNCGRCGNSCRCSDGSIKECRNSICGGCPVGPDPTVLPDPGLLG